jgi:hypothetical protein
MLGSSTAAATGQMFSRIPTLVRRLLTSTHGGVAVQIGIGLTALIGTLGLGTESTFLLFKHRQMQSVADSAALSGAMALSQEFPRDPRSEARAVAGRLGYVHGVDQVAVTVNVPPASGAQAGNPDAVEVIVSQPQDLAMMRLFGDESANVGTRSVAIRRDIGRYCILALDMAAARAMFVSNNAEVSTLDCGVAINSNSQQALVMNNNAVINGSVTTRGAWSLANNAALNGSPHIQHGPLIADPYGDVALQAAPPCTAQSGSGSNNITRNLTPGHFCSGWDFKNNVTLNLAAGTYYVDSKMSLNNNVVVNGTGVTLVVNGNYAMDISNNAVLNVSAPTSGQYAGLVFFGRRDGSPSVVQKFSNNTVLNIQGAVYFPNQIVEFDNNGATTADGCTHVIGRMVRLMNNAALLNDCDDTGVKPISPPAQLVE